MSQTSLASSRTTTGAAALPRARLALLALLAAGLALRVYLSRAPLWNDEIWSILNLQTVAGLPGVLWGLSHDNNHFLNSIWLGLVLPHSDDPMALRALSIVAGALTIPALGRIGARHGAAAGLAAAALAAFSFFQVVYSVEARGYAVATLALVLAYAEIEAERGSRRRLAVACGVGFFAHLAFAPAIAGLAFAAFVEQLRRTNGDAATAFATTFRKFSPAALACLPTLGFLAAGYRLKGGFTIGALTPFSTSHAIGGIANLAMMTFGLEPASFAAIAFTLLALPVLLLAAILTLAPVERRATYLVMLGLAPALAVLLHVPNTHVGRYFFAASPFLLVLAADSFGALWRRGAAPRVLAVSVLAAMLVSDGGAFARLARGEAHPWTEALANVAASGEPALGSSHDFNVGKTVAWFNATRNAGLELVPPERLCAAPPRWYVLETRGDGAAAATLALCDANYRLVRVYGRDIPSELPWALYRRAD